MLHTIIGIIGSAVAGGPPAAADLYHHLVMSVIPTGYWRLAEVTGVTAQDSTLANNDGTYTNTPTLAQISLVHPKHDDLSVSLDDAASEYIDMGDIAAFELSSFTLSAWIYPRTPGSGDITNNKGVIFHKQEPLTPFEGYLLALADNGSNKLQFAVDGTTMQSDAGSLDKLKSHVVVTYEVGVGVAFFVDGIAVGTSATITTAPTVGPAPFQVGARIASGDDLLFDGYIDEPALIDGVLRLEEIRYHYWLGQGGSRYDAELLSVKEPAFYSTLHKPQYLIDLSASNPNLSFNADYAEISGVDTTDRLAVIEKPRGTGAWYFEIEVVAGTTVLDKVGGGLAAVGIGRADGDWVGKDTLGYGLRADVGAAGAEWWTNNTKQDDLTFSIAAGDIIGIRVDFDAGTAAVNKNDGTFEAVTFATAAIAWSPALMTGAVDHTVNFRDGSTELPLTYTPPSGWAAWSDGACRDEYRDNVSTAEIASAVAASSSLVVGDDGLGLDFAGNDNTYQAVFPSDAAFDNDSVAGWALSFMMKVTSADLTNGTNAVPIARGDLNESWLAIFGGTNDRIELRTSLTPNNVIWTADNSMVAGTTYSILMIQDSADFMAIFVDGLLASSQTDANRQAATTANVVTVGRSVTSSSGQDFAGIVEKVGIWADDLDQIDAMRLHQASLNHHFRARLLSYRPSMYLTLDDSTGTVAANIVELTADGTYANAPTLTKASLVPNLPTSNGGVTFDGVDQSISVADATELDCANDFTIGFWINTSDTGSEQVISKRTAATSGWGVGLDGSNKISIDIETGGGAGALASLTSVNDGADHWIVIVRDQSTRATIYIDGVQDNEILTGIIVTGAVTVNTNAVYVARNPADDAGSRLAADLDEMFVAPGVVLSDVEVAQLYHIATDASYSI